MRSSNSPCGYDLQKLRQELIRDEGLRLKAYRDTLGYLTIGVGHLIPSGQSVMSITQGQAMEWLDQDIGTAEWRLTQIYPQWRSLDDVRQRALLNLAFNLGGKLGKFKRFLKAVEKCDWDQAAIQLQNSLWYKQVKLRGPRIVHAIKTGTEWRGI